jgi:beta-lactam-binding protein with PASTA domain
LEDEMREFFTRVKDFILDTFAWIRENVRKLLPHESDSQEVRSLKLTVFLFIGIIVLMMVIGFITFSIAVRGEEQTLVPNLKGKDLIVALQELQTKKLNVEIQAQFSMDAEKNTILEQSPTPGTLVKAGKEVKLRVSKGPVIDKVENYVGQTLDEVRSYLQTLFSTNTPNLIIKDPPLYRPSKGVPAGTIIAQSPKAGTKIAGLTYLEFVVSKGEGESLVEVGSYVGMGFPEAISQLTALNMPFVFSIQKAKAGQQAGTVVSQNPAEKTALTYGQVIQLAMTVPGPVGKEKVFGVFKYSLPDYPIAVDIRLDVVSEGGTATLMEMKHPGGPLSVPYIVPDGSELVLSVLDKEEVREKALAAQSGN